MSDFATGGSGPRYWIAINGPTCAMASWAMERPVCVPTPEQLIGFPTPEEARAAQQVCLRSSTAEVREFMAGLRVLVMSGRLRIIQPASPQPWTREQTLWIEGPRGDAIEQVPTSPGEV